MKTGILICGCAAAYSPLRAQESFSLQWSSLSGGGGASPETGEFTLIGSSVGQFAAGGQSSEPGEFTVTEGFWTFSDAAPDRHLTLSLDGGLVTLTWDEAGPPVTLESSADLELWEPVDPQPVIPFFQEAEGVRRFYRLSP